MTPELLAAVEAAVNTCTSWYAEYVPAGDLAGEIRLYAVEQEKRLQRWLDQDEPHRVHLALRSVAHQLGLREKARVLGFDPDDVAWYSPAMVVSLLPMALDPDWDGLSGAGEDDGTGKKPTAPGEGGTLLAMVLDVRRALGTHGFTLGSFDAATDAGQSRLQWLCDRLGGDYPAAPGYRRDRRRAVSNVAAQNLTKENE